MTEIIFNESNTRLKADVSDWESAIRLGAGILVENGVVSPSYIDGIISGILEYGPYIVIAPGIAIPHARPELGALQMGYSLVTLKEPVFFDGEPEPVKVLLSFAATDSDKHLDLLKMIVAVINDGLIDKIAQIDDIEELKGLMQKKRAKLDHCDISSASGARADLFIAGKNFESQFQKFSIDAPKIFLNRMVDKKEIEEKLTPVLQGMGEI